MRTADWIRELAQRLNLNGAENGLSPSGKDASEPNASNVDWLSVPLEARPLFIASLYRETPCKCLIVTTTYERALQWQAKLIICGVVPESISLLPSGISALFEDAMPEHIALSDRLGALRHLVEDFPHIVITTPQAVLEKTLPRDILLKSFFEVNPGDTIDVIEFSRKLVNLGYEHQEPVRIPGGFSRRGGIIDIFPVGRETPVRIELFGDEVESIRLFDPNTQRSVGSTTSLKIAPSRETLFTGGESHLQELIQSSLEKEQASLGEAEAERLGELIQSDLDTLNSRTFFDRLDLYRPLIFPDSGCAIDLLDEGGWLILDEPLELEVIAERSEEELSQSLTARHNRGEILSAYANDYLSSADQLGRDKNSLCLSAMNDLPRWAQHAEQVDFGAATLEPYRGRAEVLTQTLKNYLTQGFEVILTTDQPSRATTVLGNVDILVSESPGEGRFAICHGNIGGGFVLPNEKIAVISDAELFGVARLKLPQRRFMEGAPVATVLDLKPGDYVVHIHFGIGIFRGLVKRTEGGLEREFLYVEYGPPDKLFVPADQLDRIQKYLNPGDEHPKLNRLVGNEWQKTLGKAKDEAREFARDLVKLYAKRKQVLRRAFGPDTPWQAELEATFPYVETPAQLSAIKDVKRDLEMEYPMDRLICGDVGFGKTEVAIRAAFKVVQDRRQVAILCPTTILSEQHFRNFSERIGSFGTKIALLNRFRTTAERRDTLEKVKSGEVEILIGTHSLLGQGINFKELGLVIVDEEQKFGVKQKEMLKHLRTEVDMLTLSATPIPRTLNMALMDIRQMSLINDPPPGRLPIRTFVRSYSDEVIREAILRELARGGQVFYVYNRVDSINHVAQRLKKLVPTARIGIGHGQMDEKALEPIMIGFIEGEIDILLSTTIIENGIDISNANTLIVENADRLGLSQLYQLRGRVGRSDRQAYSYFLHGAQRDMTETGVARLQALQEFSTLGSGYSLAFRDLQIRGAGDILGAKQHGTMAAIGYELFTQLINEAVAMLKNSVDAAPGEFGEAVEDPLAALTPLPVFDISIAALIPDKYIREQAQRLYYYQRMMSSRSEKILQEVSTEMNDRYGKMPEEVQNAFSVMGQRIRCRKLGIEKVEAKPGRILISFEDLQSQSPRVFSIMSKKKRDCFLAREGFVWPYVGNVVHAIESFLTHFKDAVSQIESERAALGV